MPCANVARPHSPDTHVASRARLIGRLAHGFTSLAASGRFVGEGCEVQVALVEPGDCLATIALHVTQGGQGVSEAWQSLLDRRLSDALPNPRVPEGSTRRGEPEVGGKSSYA